MFGTPFRDLCSILGLCWILYTISQVINLFELHKEDKNAKQTFFDSAATLFSILLKIFSLPVSVVSGFLVSKFCERLTKKHNKDMNHASLKYKWKCSHCYSQVVSFNRPFGYNLESCSWDKTDDPFSLYIPHSFNYPGSWSSFVDRLSDDYFEVLSRLYPFNPSYIGKRLSDGEIIDSENSYYEYLKSRSFDMALRFPDFYYNHSLFD